MYLTIAETADYLNVSTADIHRLIREKQIRTVSDGENSFIYKEQFNLFIKELEKYKKELQDYLNEPIPEDIDIKDED
ncbi:MULTISPECIES: excisionase family DNA-binding protein [Carnobacterium]|uniref:DNA-binding protein n=1 Tax=Carnobacterium divergens TaxID=2748 RepID=A0A2R7ZZH5_CARDV|nr:MULTISPECIES: helix-turn-helix domain-containing protein [Carnobacterium]MCO6018037.1 excisionase family DNA-binding protein [Carnobacterium divergens]MDT1938605.1 excisionase family DNA-binding protein [Carnobacterium divergens]MDT1941043.1 excisionase family DNA-binding protein [Carnobacterium divergens]MDT1946841.1 excisionase family DNA-binding protein [Carnobacterium divergens]MDT1949278.1 excisionase family DNA-binding protein [Carnobacterium divergens]